MISGTRATDPRPARTRTALLDALFELIQEKRWEHIRVQDILDRAGLGRSTFYAHFDSKFDLLTASIPAVTLPVAEPGEGVPNLRSMFDHVEEMQPILRPLMSQPLLSEINDAFHRQLVEAWTVHLAARRVRDPQREFIATCLAGAFLATSRSWMATRCRRPAADVCDDYTTMAAAVIDSLA